MGQLLLVRHGQASWGAEDYDVLSETGWEQGRVLGRALAERGLSADVVVSGGMRRHDETMQGCLEAVGWPAPQTDERWAEFDHVDTFGAHPVPWGEGERPSSADFQAWFDAATGRWTSGEHDADYAETFRAFGARVDAALDATAEAAGSGTAVVFTSGGAIAWVTASLLAVEHGVRRELWGRLNPVCVNTGVTKVVTGRRGRTFVTFNDHAHLEGRPELLSYR